MDHTNRGLCEKIRAQILLEINKTVPILKDMHRKYKVHPPEKQILVIDTNAAIAKDAVRTYARKLKTFIDLYESDLLRQIDETVENKRKLVEDTKVNYQNIARLASTLSHTADQPDTVVLHYDGKISEELQEALSTRPFANDFDIDELTFVDNPNSSSFVHEGFGFLKTSSFNATDILLTKSTALVSLGCTYTVQVKMGNSTSPEIDDNLTCMVKNLFTREKFIPPWKSLSNGIFQCTFLPEKPGVFQFEAQFLGRDVQGSPFIFFVFDRKPKDAGCLAQGPCKVEEDPFDLSNMECLLQQMTTMPLKSLHTAGRTLSMNNNQEYSSSRRSYVPSLTSQGLEPSAARVGSHDNASMSIGLGSSLSTGSGERLITQRVLSGKYDGILAMEPVAVRNDGCDKNFIYLERDAEPKRSDDSTSFGVETFVVHESGSDCLWPPLAGISIDTVSTPKPAVERGCSQTPHAPPPEKGDEGICARSSVSTSPIKSEWYMPEPVHDVEASKIPEDRYALSSSAGKYSVTPHLSVMGDSMSGPFKQNASDSSSNEEEVVMVEHRNGNVTNVTLHSQKLKKQHNAGPVRTLPIRKKGWLNLVNDVKQCGKEAAVSATTSDGAFPDTWSPNASNVATALSDDSLPVVGRATIDNGGGEQWNFGIVDESRIQVEENMKTSKGCATDPISSVTVTSQQTVLDKFFKGNDGASLKGATLKAKLVRKIHDDLQYPIGIEVDSVTQDIWLCDTGSDRVKKFSWLGQLLVVIGEKKRFRRPSAIRLNKDGDLFIKDDVQIHVFSKEYAFKHAFGKGLMVKPYGLVWTHDDNLMTLDQSRAKTRIIVFSQSGALLTNCVLEPLARTIAGSKVRFFGVSLARLVISDLGLSTIYITDLNGRELASIGSFGKAPTLYNEPSGVAVDRSGNVIIGDSKNNRLQLYKYDFSYGGVLELDDNIVRPSDIFLTKDDHLLVVNFLQHCVKVFKLTVQ